MPYTYLKSVTRSSDLMHFILRAYTALRHTFRPALALVLSLAVSGCANQPPTRAVDQWQSAITGAGQAAKPGRHATDQALVGASDQEQAADPQQKTEMYLPGSGKFIATPAIAQSIAQAKRQTDGDIKLNFQNANLLEVIKVILGDMLNATYVIDPNVQGTVSMQTNGALRQQDLIPTLEMLLRMNDAAVIIDDDVYRVLPLAMALTDARARQLGDATLALPPGYSVRVVPLKFVAAEEMAQILEPFVIDTNQLVRVDTRRNLLILAANGNAMERLLETIRMFDVNRMQGMSVALFSPDFVDAKTLAEELEKLLADPEQGLMSGMLRFIVVERLNGLMVITPNAQLLAQVKQWVNRLDRDNGGLGRRLFIYRVQNGKAVDLASTLSQLFNTESSNNVPNAEVAPGLTAATIGDEGLASEPAPVSPSKASQSFSLGDSAQIRVIADQPNNALLILASAIEYRQILSALQQLDISPMQVLVEVTIAEVSLTDDLQYGVEWFFNNRVGSSLTGLGTLDLAAGGISALTPGFSYALQGGNNTVNAVLNLLATESNLSIVSSPSLLVLNNQEASIQVGDEVPVYTQQQQSTLQAPDGTANIINSIEYRETGVQLKVKPRINAGGLVIMEVEQETSLPNATPLTPRIQTRKIASTVAVNSGDTIILGGLIQDNQGVSQSGIPSLRSLPIIGSLFGTTADQKGRTELLVLITPRAITHRNSALQVTEEFRRRLHSLIPPPASKDGI